MFNNQNQIFSHLYNFLSEFLWVHTTKNEIEKTDYGPNLKHDYIHTQFFK